MPVLGQVRSLLRRAGQSEFAKNTAKLAMGQGLRLAIQAVYFVMIARSLGPKQYGAFVAMTSLVAVAAPFAGFGSPMILLKYVARDRTQFPVYWGNGLLTILVSGFLLSFLILGICTFLLGHGFFFLTILVCISDLLMIRVAELATFAFAAIGQMGESARINVYITSTKLVGIVILTGITRHPDVKDWTYAYVLGSLVCFVYAMIRTTRAAGAIHIRPRQAWKNLPEASLFAVSSSSATIYNDIDKTMVGKLASFTDTGIYGAAYRIIDVSLVPVRAMLSAAYPEFFRLGVGGPLATKAYAYKLIKRSTPFGALVAVSLILGAPVIPHVLGKNYHLRCRSRPLAGHHPISSLYPHLPCRWTHRRRVSGKPDAGAGRYRCIERSPQHLFHSQLGVAWCGVEQRDLRRGPCDHSVGSVSVHHDC